MSMTDAIELGWTSYISTTKRDSDQIKAVETAKTAFKIRIQELEKVISALNSAKTPPSNDDMQSLTTAANNAQLAFNLFGSTFTKIHDADTAWIKSTGLISQDSRNTIVLKSQDVDFDFVSSMMMGLNGAMSAVYAVYDKLAELEESPSHQGQV